MSPRAAWRLESLGFTQVYDYGPGKADWLAGGLPTDGTEADIPRAGDVARRDVPTCGLSDRVGEARTRAREAGWDVCLVLNEERVVLGRLRGEAFDGPPDVAAEEAMEPGPTTTRPSTSLSDIVRRLRDQDVERIVVTTSDGRLVGILDRRDAERRLEQREGASA